MYTSPITYAAEQETQGPIVRKVDGPSLDKSLLSNDFKI